MIRRLLTLVITVALMAACSNTGKNEASKSAETGNAVKVEFASLVANPAEFVGRNIAVEGKVVHVCTMSGKKLFIVGENPDIRLFIQAGENMPKFPMELLGSTVEVEGNITRTGALAMTGAEHGTGTGMKHEGAMAADTCETATALAAQTALANIVMDYRSHVVK